MYISFIHTQFMCYKYACIFMYAYINNYDKAIVCNLNPMNKSNIAN